MAESTPVLSSPLGSSRRRGPARSPDRPIPRRIMRRRARTDENQAAYVRALRQIPGVSVLDLSRLGQGAPDLAVGYDGRTTLVELKNPAMPPSARKLTPDEERFRDGWTGSYLTTTDLSEILEAIGVTRRSASRAR